MSSRPNRALDLTAACALRATLTRSGAGEYEHAKQTSVMEARCRPTRTMQRTVKSVTLIASAIYAPLFPAADRKR